MLLVFFFVYPCCCPCFFLSPSLCPGTGVEVCARTILCCARALLCFIDTGLGCGSRDAPRHPCDGDCRAAPRSRSKQHLVDGEACGGAAARARSAAASTVCPQHDSLRDAVASQPPGAACAARASRARRVPTRGPDCPAGDFDIGACCGTADDANCGCECPTRGAVGCQREPGGALAVTCGC